MFHRSAKAAPATFDHLPLHLQSHIFTLSTAPPDTCKVAAAITQDLQLAAEWLLTKHQQEKEPLHLLRTAAKHKHWRLCAWAVQHKRYWSAGDLNKTLLAATRAGQVDLVRFLLQQQGGWAGWLWTEPKLQPYCEHYWYRRQCMCRYRTLLATKPDLNYIDNELQSLVLEEPHPLVQAAKQGHKELFALFLQQGANIQAAGQALEAAAGGGYMELVQMLFTKMPRVVRQLEAVREAVCAAAGAGHLSVIQLLILYAPGVKQPGLGPSPLVSAALGGHLHVMRFFLQKFGAGTAYGFTGNVWGSSDNSPSPCEAAAQAGSVEALQLLVDSGYRWIPGQWAAALSSAVVRGHASVIKMLLSVLTSRAFWLPHEQLNTVLWHAARLGNTEVVQLLLKDVPNPEDIAAAPDNILYAASAAGHADVVRIILQRCKRRRELDCISAFKAAAGRGHVSVLQLLNGNGGANAGDEKYQSWAPLEVAIRRQHINVVAWLLEQGAQANQQALLDALQQRAHPILQLLAQHGVEDVGDRALYVAAQLGDIPAVELLLSAAHGKQQEAGAQAVATRMEVALCSAASCGRVQLGGWLLDSAAAAASTPTAATGVGAQHQPGAPSAAATAADAAAAATGVGAAPVNPGATATDTVPALITMPCAYTPAMLNKALQAVIMGKECMYRHPTHQELWWDWKAPGWVPDGGGDRDSWDEGNNHAQFARLLVKAGADTQCEEYKAALLTALRRERIGVFKALMEAGPVPAVVRGGQALRSGAWASCDDMAAAWRLVYTYTNPACVNLGEALAYVCHKVPHCICIVHMLLKLGADVNYNNGAPLSKAIFQTGADAAALLLLHGAHVEESQVERLHRMVAEEEGGAQLARALKVRGIHLKGPHVSREKGAETATAPDAAQAM
jgi:ankyrin repeat protein